MDDGMHSMTITFSLEAIIKERLQIDERVLRRISKRLLHDTEPIDIEYETACVYCFIFYFAEHRSRTSYSISLI